MIFIFEYTFLTSLERKNTAPAYIVLKRAACRNTERCTMSILHHIGCVGSMSIIDLRLDVHRQRGAGNDK